MLSEGTIIALSTPQGSGAIGVIRLSGLLAIEKAAYFIHTKSKKSWNEIIPNTAFLGDFKVGNQLIDEVLITFFKGPHSYTGEDVVEISCHGSSYIQQKIITSFLGEGILPAQAGEFTLRAYLNKKMDLSQAEAVADIIASENEAAHTIAMQQMRGGFSQNMEELRQQLIQFKALIELELDFSEEEVNFANKDQLSQLLRALHKDINTLKLSFAYGNVIKKGVPVAIAGKPNAGKSSLLNALFKEEKAIVSDIPGTTRDLIEDTLIIEGISFRFIDTAGLRETKDVVEAMGVKKAKDKINQATLLLYLYERTTDFQELSKEVKTLQHDNLNIVLIENKIDQSINGFDTDFNQRLLNTIQEGASVHGMGISTLDEQFLEPLKKYLVKTIQTIGNNSTVIVNNTRHFHALTQALESLEVVMDGIKNDIPGDLLSVELKETIFHIGSITGKIDTDEDILGTIFGQFCIGK
ncbi:MAG: tRNA uridine-5-carboxymethylaminomethyl(34) synthesis GTPase MnmE [Flavobacteriaceae bacterium]|nr:tRNA uridine-5-carboxymethylaminomethyl(34) synthesis GTPase MnmE [Flavobacteriaceae bacterium]